MREVRQEVSRGQVARQSAEKFPNRSGGCQFEGGVVAIENINGTIKETSKKKTSRAHSTQEGAGEKKRTRELVRGGCPGKHISIAERKKLQLKKTKKYRERRRGWDLEEELKR